VRAAPVVRENEQYLPYLQQQFEDAGRVNQARQGWDVLRWELEFVRLFNLLHFNARDFDVDGALKGFGVLIRDDSPISRARSGPPVASGWA